jgi:hypothetical protein
MIKHDRLNRPVGGIMIKHNRLKNTFERIMIKHNRLNRPDSSSFKKPVGQNKTVQ